MAGFKCPFCGEIMSVHHQTRALRFFNFEHDRLAFGAQSPHLQVSIYHCPNNDCRKDTIIADGINNYIQNAHVPIFPQTICRQFPDYVPHAIRKDYEEACAIVNYSPKASAALARRCLQGMIRDFWDIHEKNLYAEISQLKDKIPASQWKAIDALRCIGNIGAHMEHDVNLIVDVDSDEAQKLIRLIEHLIDKWYVERHDSEELYAELAAINQEKQYSRKH